MLIHKHIDLVLRPDFDELAFLAAFALFCSFVCGYHGKARHVH
jgi:hypothetical protein